MTLQNHIQEITQVFTGSTNIQHENLHKLSGDASSRIYWRYSKNGESLITCLYPEKTSLDSLKRFVYWQKKYSEAGINVPKIFHVDYQKQVVILQDVGDELLQLTLGCSSTEVTLKKLTDVILTLPKIWKISVNDYDGKIPRFDLNKLSFEIDHTIKYFIESHLEEKSSKTIQELRNAWNPILNRLEKLPMVLCHRDFHSRNIMSMKDNIVIIDFQDSMYGSIHYDICSLLDDCYLHYQPAIYQKILRTYFDLCQQENQNKTSYEDFFVNYQMMKLQRQFKAIGSFAYVWEHKKNPRFLKYISYVLESMKTSFDVLDLPDVKNIKQLLLRIYYAH